MPRRADPGEKGASGCQEAMGAEGVAGNRQVKVRCADQLAPVASGLVVSEFQLRQPAADASSLHSRPHGC